MDSWLNLRGSVKPANDVLIVAYDDETRDTMFKNKKFGLQEFTDLLEVLKEHNVKRVVFDAEVPDGTEDERTAFKKVLEKIPVIIPVMIKKNGRVSEVDPEFKARANIAFTNTFKESNIARFFPLWLAEDSKIPFLALAGAGYYEDKNLILPNENSLINHYGPARTIKTVSYLDIMQDNLKDLDELLSGKIVVFGGERGVGQASFDRHASPFLGSTDIYGCEVQANEILNIIHQDWIEQPFINVMKIFSYCFIVVMVFVLFGLSVTKIISTVFTIELLWFLSGYLLYCRNIAIDCSFLFICILPTMSLLIITKKIFRLKTQEDFDY